MTPWTVAAGLALGWVYTMSPLLVVTGVGFALVLRWASLVDDAQERQCVVAVLTAAIALRVLAVGGLFLSVDHASTTFAFLFGDEDYFIRRSIWLRNTALGIPISAADTLYAFDRAISTSLVWLLATLHLLFGPSPYGVRLVSALFYVAGAVALYRAVRPSFGFPASVIGLIVLLFLPSLFIWSISVLKEPLFFAIMAAIVSLTMVAARDRRWLARAAAVVAIGLAAYLAQTVREGGLIVALLGTVGGLVLGFMAARPRWLAVSAILAILVLPSVLSRGVVQDRIVANLTAATLEHWEHVNAAGHSFTIFPPAFYLERPAPGSLSVSDGARLVVGGLVAYVLMPTPGEMHSRSELAYLPEQMLWYALVLMAPIGVWAALKRDRFLASLLLAHLAVAVLLVAMNSGNIGTLVRHRALALPALIWFSGLGVVRVVALVSGGAVPAADAAARRNGAWL